MHQNRIKLLEKIIKNIIKSLNEMKLTRGQQVWIRAKVDSEFVKGYVIDTDRIRTKKYDLVFRDEFQDYIIKTEDPGSGPHKIIDPARRKWEKEYQQIIKSPLYKTVKIPGAMSKTQFDKKVKQIAMMSDDEELSYSSAADLAMNLYYDVGVKEYLRGKGITTFDAALKYLTDEISNYA